MKDVDFEVKLPKCNKSVGVGYISSELVNYNLEILDDNPTGNNNTGLFKHRS
jgi:hypothetical protein